MATLKELNHAVEESLRANGTEDKVKAMLRAKVFQLLEGDGTVEQAPRPCNDNVVINELIREYLEFNQYKHAASVLQLESGQPETPIPRHILEKDLNLHEKNSNDKVPLLYSIIHQLKKQDE